MKTNNQLVSEQDVKIVVQEPELAAEEPEKEETIKLIVKQQPIEIKVIPPIKVSLNIRRSLGGDYMVFDHPLYDIVIMPDKNKIVTFTKRDARMDPYPSQDKFFDYLDKKGALTRDSVQGGNVFGSLEATYPSNDKVNTLEVLLLIIHSFMKEETKEINAALEYDMAVDDMYADPSEQDSTELGEVPHEEEKGSIPRMNMPYGLIYRL